MGDIRLWITLGALLVWVLFILWGVRRPDFTLTDDEPDEHEQYPGETRRPE